MKLRFQKHQNQRENLLHHPNNRPSTPQPDRFDIRSLLIGVHNAAEVAVVLYRTNNNIMLAAASPPPAFHKQPAKTVCGPTFVLGPGSSTDTHNKLQTATQSSTTTTDNYVINLTSKSPMACEKDITAEVARGDPSSKTNGLKPHSKNSDSSNIEFVNVLIKLRTHVVGGIPEIGLMIAPSKPMAGTVKCCKIKQVQHGSPAQRCKSIKCGDVINRINSVDVSMKDPEEVVEMLRKAAQDSKWTYAPVRLQLARETLPDGCNNADPSPSGIQSFQPHLMNLMNIAIKKNTKMVASKKPNPIRLTLLQRSFCDKLDKALSDNGYYDAIYNV